ncbi:hypothetical protein [Bacillus solimangrovi]|uniref:CBS domain-containing protein n=1 Tax=Bacillus solimangrovi TaxID=1305675 RepID=A0A1E5LFW8_9BACI|nr:hypothetical protein [Bacillus solimangrovi]OEH92977.1 hypothetical protein BFG57_14010 [Bacillus solimangrovi]
MEETRTNAERFLTAFNIITKELESLIGLNKYIPFAKLVDMAKKRNGTVLHFVEDLKEYSALRNAIVHDRDFPERVIAEPHITVVEKMEQIAKELEAPQLLIPNFQKKVISFDINDRLQLLMDGIETYGFSQFPIMEDGACKGLITDRGITRWFVHHANELEMIPHVTLRDIMSFERNIKNYVFMSQSKNIYDVRELFYHHLERYQVRLEAVLITKNGNNEESLLGIVTPFDIVRLPV